MATKEVKWWWDPYETSHRRHFVYQPVSAAQILLCPKSTLFIDAYTPPGSFGSTVYNKDFSWRKPDSKPEYIRKGEALGERRNHPHPSQSFMMWRLPRNARCVRCPGRCSPSEGEIRKALTAQYCSTYRRDFMGLPQGYDPISDAERRLQSLHSSRHVLLSTQEDMRDSNCQPPEKHALMGNHSHCSRNRDRNVACHGIVPTAVQRHVDTQEKRSDLTTYDSFCGKRVRNVTSVLESPLPRELQHLHRTLPTAEKEVTITEMSNDTYPSNLEKVNTFPAIVLKSSSPERISSWTGPH